MVTSVTALTSSGLRDWLIQRVSAVILGIYTLFLIGFWMLHHPLDFNTWHTLFSNVWMRFFSFLALLSLVTHSWVGVWTIFTDYIKPFALRLFLQVILVLALFVYLAWGIQIIWGV